ncbi:MAG: hypothetical protein ACE5FD_14205 [Anaerolineae bacterium]
MGKEAELLGQAVAAIKNKQRARGRALLRELLRLYPENATGWALMSVVASSDSEQKECLANVLVLDPDNKYARRAVRKLKAGQKVMPPLFPEKIQSPVYPVFNSLKNQELASIVLNGYNISDTDFLGRTGKMHSFKIVGGELRQQWRNQDVLSFQDEHGRFTYIRVAALPVEKDGFGLLEIL